MIGDLLKRIFSGTERAEQGSCRPDLEASMDGFWLVDRRGRLASVNQAYCGMSGYSAEELLGMSVLRLESDEPPPPGAAPAPKRSWDGPFETRHRRKDGGYYDVEVNSRFLPDAGGRFAVFIKDISWRKNLERTLLDMRARVAGAIAGTGLGTWDWDVASGTVRFCARCSELLGLPPESMELTVEEWTAGLHPEDAPAANERLWRCLNGEAETFNFEARYAGRGGWVRILTTARVAAAGHGGVPVSVVGALKALGPAHVMRLPVELFTPGEMVEAAEDAAAVWEPAGAVTDGMETGITQAAEEEV